LQVLNEMYETDVDKIKEQLNKVLSFVDPAYIEALLAFHKSIPNQNIGWAVGGDLGEALQTIQVEPDRIEIITRKEGANQIFSAVKEYNPKSIEIQTTKLARNAIVSGIEYPIYIRSYFFEFFLGCVKINVQGDLQYKINDWDWGDKLEFTPNYVNVAGAKTAVVPLEVELEIYRSLGWTDRSEKIEQKIGKRSR
jgi:hypothetical protein